MKHSTTLLVSLLLASTAVAQSASYTLFGEGCNGSPVASNLSLNDNPPALQVASLPNEYAYPVINTTGQAIQVVGFEIFTTTNTGLTETVKTGVLFDNSGPTATTHTTPSPTNTANGTITVQAAQTWYSTSVYPPVTIPAGVEFWLHVDAYGKVAPPQHTTTGGVAGPVSNYYRRPSNNMVWTISVSVARQMYRVHYVTDTPTVPSMLATTLPQFGANFTLQLAGGQAFAPAFLIYAFDNTQWASLPTPVDLGMFGAPTCYNQTSADIASFVLLDGTGAASTGFAVPTDPSYSGLTWYNQSAMVVPGANALDMLFSNAGTAVVGN